MGRARKRKERNFTQISNNMLEDNRLSWKAKGLLSYLMSRPEEWEVRMFDIVRRSTDGELATRNGVKELKEQKYLHQIRYHDGKRLDWEWVYDDEPFEESEACDSKQEQYGGFQQIGFQHIENRQIYKEEVNNTKLNNTKDLLTLLTLTTETEKRAELIFGYIEQNYYAQTKLDLGLDKKKWEALFRSVSFDLAIAFKYQDVQKPEAYIHKAIEKVVENTKAKYRDGS